MNWRISLVIIAVGFFACKRGPVETTSTLASSPYLISAEELIKTGRRENIKIIDFRTKEKYNEGHITGALNIWRSDIEDTAYEYKGMMASPSQIEALFSNLGIRTTDTLILYDDIGLCNAARLWWILQNYEFKNVRMLHGGLGTWEDLGGVMNKETPSVDSSVFELGTPSMRYHISKDELLNSISDGVTILDTRTTDEYAGKMQKKGASKAGRISKSIHIDWAEAIDYNGDKKFKNLEDLEAIYGRLEADKKDPIIVYCHSGVRSAHSFFVLTQLLGYENVKNYDGSWTEWSYFDHLPFETDSINSNKL